MYYVIGLGNPGEKYAATRHNVGWQALDYWLRTTGFPTLYERAGLSGRLSEGRINNEPVTVLYPDTYMNHSGAAVAQLVPREAVDRLVVVYDDVDIPFGACKVSVGGGAGGHNGIKSITARMGTPAYIRVRIGIAPRGFFTGAPKRPTGAALPNFVLKPFTSREQKALPAVLDTVAAVLTTIVTDGVSTAMNRYN